jgi:hypothetical protein
MAEKEPATEQPYLTQDATPAPWAEARERLADADPYWLATVRPDGLPHLVPILAVWVDGALHFVAQAQPPAKLGTSRATRTASSRRGRKF